jgi:mycothiol synthase
MSGTTIREVETGADYEAWRQVRIAVHPHERTATVDELRARASPCRLLVLAERGGAVVAAGMLTCAVRASARRCWTT